MGQLQQDVEAWCQGDLMAANRVCGWLWQELLIKVSMVFKSEHLAQVLKGFSAGPVDEGFQAALEELELKIWPGAWWTKPAAETARTRRQVYVGRATERKLTERTPLE